jgi:CDP-diglyceride synthetase
MPVLQAAYDNSRNGLFKVAAGGVVTGVLTPLFQPLIDKVGGSPGDFRIALLAVPFAVLILMLVRRNSANPWWAALAAAVVTMAAFVCAVNAGVWVDGQIPIDAKAMRNVSSGFVGGFTGAVIMALGICLLPAGPRDATAWLPMLIVGTVAGALLAIDSALELDLLSVLYPVWQAGAAVGLVMALQRSDAGSSQRRS